MSKFTPGPYHIEGAIIYSGDIPLAIVSGLGMADNSPLFSAAPDMYKALNDLLNCISETRGSDAHIAQLAAIVALAKADGK